MYFNKVSFFYSNEKTSMTKDVLNAKKAKREAETKLEERNSFIEELQVFFFKDYYNHNKENNSELYGSVKIDIHG